jgi:hypothetical protein
MCKVNNATQHFKSTEQIACVFLSSLPTDHGIWFATQLPNRISANEDRISRAPDFDENWDQQPPRDDLGRKADKFRQVLKMTKVINWISFQQSAAAKIIQGVQKVFNGVRSTGVGGTGVAQAPY